MMGCGVLEFYVILEFYDIRIRNMLRICRTEHWSGSVVDGANIEDWRC